jgi:hypothetical protein
MKIGTALNSQLMMQFSSRRQARKWRWLMA